MLVVSCRLLACRREISSWMLTSESELTCFSSSIFASSSAMGCSKSRNATAIYLVKFLRDAGGYMKRKRPSIAGRLDPGRPAIEGSSVSSARARRRAVNHTQSRVTDKRLQLLDQLTSRLHIPVRAESQCARGTAATVLDGNGAGAAPPGAKNLCQSTA